MGRPCMLYFGYDSLITRHLNLVEQRQNIFTYYNYSSLNSVQLEAGNKMWQQLQANTMSTTKLSTRNSPPSYFSYAQVYDKEFSFSDLQTLKREDAEANVKLVSYI